MPYTKEERKRRLTKSSNFTLDRASLKLLIERLSKEELTDFLLTCLDKNTISSMLLDVYSKYHLPTNHRIQLYFFRKLKEMGGSYESPKEM